MSKKPLIGVVILNYKIADQTLTCIKSVLKSSFKNLQLFVVDNGSDDGLEEILPDDKKITFIQTNENLGYTGGNNVGIQAALDQECDYIFVLNPDTTITPDTIQVMLDKSEKLKADVINPKIYFSDSNILWFAGKTFDWANVLGTHRGVDEEDTGKYNKDMEMEDLTGAAIFARREVFEKVGLFDERFFLYYEDTDLAMRIKDAGFSIWYVPQAVVYHKNAQTTGVGSPLQDYFIIRNRMLLASKYLPMRTRFALLREALRTSYYGTRRKALKDFFLGNFGKGSFIK